MDRVRKLDVYYHNKKVGTMALYQERLAAFEYDKEWIAEGFSISPFSLPLEQKVYIPKIDPLDGLFGVFSDSLPDGWGRLLVDRFMIKKGMDPNLLGNLDRLAIVGSNGMGALTYRPVISYDNTENVMTYDDIAKECERILQDKDTKNLDNIFDMGGSSGGARPKILTKVDGEDWIIKFRSTDDSKEIGLEEYDYLMCAKECGIETSDARLFPSKKCKGYFGTKRFDRLGADETDKVHMVSAAALLETSHRIPNLDYDLLMRLTLQLTKDMEECMKMYRRMCFNVFAHNRDDHSKNFSFLYDEKENRWKTSPAYDMTYSHSLGGEHATTVHGNGNDPGIKDVLEVAKNIGINQREATQIANQIQEIVEDKLGRYLK